MSLLRVFSALAVMASFVLSCAFSSTAQADLLEDLVFRLNGGPPALPYTVAHPKLWADMWSVEDIDQELGRHGLKLNEKHAAIKHSCVGEDMESLKLGYDISCTYVVPAVKPSKTVLGYDEPMICKVTLREFAADPNEELLTSLESGSVVRRTSEAECTSMNPRSPQSNDDLRVKLLVDYASKPHCEEHSVDEGIDAGSAL